MGQVWGRGVMWLKFLRLQTGSHSGSATAYLTMQLIKEIEHLWLGL